MDQSFLSNVNDQAPFMVGKVGHTADPALLKRFREASTRAYDRMSDIKSTMPAYNAYRKRVNASKVAPTPKPVQIAATQSDEYYGPALPKTQPAAQADEYYGPALPKTQPAAQASQEVPLMLQGPGPMAKSGINFLNPNEGKYTQMVPDIEFQGPTAKQSQGQVPFVVPTTPNVAAVAPNSEIIESDIDFSLPSEFAPEFQGPTQPINFIPPATPTVSAVAPNSEAIESEIDFSLPENLQGPISAIPEVDTSIVYQPNVAPDTAYVTTERPVYNVPQFTEAQMDSGRNEVMKQLLNLAQRSPQQTMNYSAMFASSPMLQQMMQAYMQQAPNVQAPINYDSSMVYQMRQAPDTAYVTAPRSTMADSLFTSRQ
jgi:hypothetical protein